MRVDSAVSQQVMHLLSEMRCEGRNHAAQFFLGSGDATPRKSPARDTTKVGLKASSS